MADNRAPQQRGGNEPKVNRRYKDAAKAPRYTAESGRADRQDRERTPSSPRGRREYYRKKEAMRKKRAKKRAVIICTVAAILLTLGIIAVFIVNGLSAHSETDSASSAAAETIPTAPAATAPAEYTPVTKELPEVEDNGADGYTDGSLYIWNSMGFDIFKGDEKSALAYSGAIAQAKKTLGGEINVYNMVVPNHTAYGLPDRILDELDTNAQRDNITVIYSNYGEQVIPVDIYNELGEKRNDYIFYNTDNRWTSLGAYQAYTAFASAAGFEPIELEALKKNTIDGYSGSYVKSTGNAELQASTDVVEYYEIPGNYECSVIERSPDGTVSQESKKVEMYKTELSDDEDSLNVFIHGDNPLFIIDNKDKSDGNKLLVVKDTFGSTLVPFLASNYDEVHVIDFRYYSGSIKEYCNKKGIKNVLFLNGIMSANSAAQINKLRELLV